MERRHIAIIKVNFRYLVDNITVKDGIIDFLFSVSILNEDDLEEILDCQPRAATRLLLIKLPKRGPKAFREFINALRECEHEYAAEKLEATKPEDMKEDHVDAFIEEAVQTKVLLMQKQLTLQTQLIMVYEEEKAQLQHKVESKEAQNTELKEKFAALQESLVQSGIPQNDIGTLVSKVSKIQPDSGHVLEDLDDFDRMELILAKDIITYFVCGKEKAPPPPNSLTQTIRIVVEDMSTKHEEVFVSCIKTLTLNNIKGFGTFHTILNEMVSDHHMNWGRVVVVHALFGYFAREARERDSKQLEQILVQILSTWVSRHLKVWIISHGGWEAVIPYFSKPPVLPWHLVGLPMAAILAYGIFTAIRGST